MALLARWAGASPIIAVLGITGIACLAPALPSKAIAESPPVASSNPAPTNVKEGDAFIAERRPMHPAATWQPASPTKWARALSGYQTKIHPGNKRLLGSAMPALARYANAMHNRIHPVFSDDFLGSLEKLAPTDPRNLSTLQVRLEIALDRVEGRIVDMGVVSSSGSTDFDRGALESVEEAAPFGPPPAEALSSDGNIYFWWEFRRNPVYACSTMNARPFIIHFDPVTPSDAGASP